MGIPLTKYGFAVASTNAGHNGYVLGGRMGYSGDTDSYVTFRTVDDGTFAMNNPESQVNVLITVRYFSS